MKCNSGSLIVLKVNTPSKGNLVTRTIIITFYTGSLQTTESKVLGFFSNLTSIFFTKKKFSSSRVFIAQTKYRNDTPEGAQTSA